MATAKVKLTKNHQITIPAKVRRKLGIEPGDIIEIEVEGRMAVLHAAKLSWTERSYGLGADMWRKAGGGAAVIERERKSWGED
jgi:AbrB family looped-hinge helix DNA binding protein